MSEFYDKWDTTPVQAKPPRKVKGQTIYTESGTYQPENYTADEWVTRKSVERMGDDAWQNSNALDMSEFDYL